MVARQDNSIYTNFFDFSLRKGCVYFSNELSRHDGQLTPIVNDALSRAGVCSLELRKSKEEKILLKLFFTEAKMSELLLDMIEIT